jgi:hypothetical protein
MNRTWNSKEGTAVGEMNSIRTVSTHRVYSVHIYVGLLFACGRRQKIVIVVGGGPPVLIGDLNVDIPLTDIFKVNTTQNARQERPKQAAWWEPATRDIVDRAPLDQGIVCAMASRCL